MTTAFDCLWYLADPVPLSIPHIVRTSTPGPQSASLSDHTDSCAIVIEDFDAIGASVPVAIGPDLHHVAIHVEPLHTLRCLSA